MTHKKGGHHIHHFAREPLRLTASRIVKPRRLGSHGEPHTKPHDGHSNDHTDMPLFDKHHSASNLELFYDLWFIANLSVFSSTHEIANTKNLLSYIGYIVLLWTTWLITSIYDVRFSTDSVLERCCKAVHFGVMIGFAMIGPSFDPEHQVPVIFKTLSRFLAASRVILSIQYALVMWHLRKYWHVRRHMFLTVATHFAAGMVYLGISLRQNKSSRVYIVWYLLGIVEMAWHLGTSQLSHALTFIGTNFGERLNLLTLIILGEGVIILAKNMSYLVKDYLKGGDADDWGPSLIGFVISSTALIYIIFQLYFDWMCEDQTMSKEHQVWWASIHLPFHIALVLLLEGSNTFILGGRIHESIKNALGSISYAMENHNGNLTSEDVAEKTESVLKKFVKKYPPANSTETMEQVKDLVDDMASIPDSYWVTFEGTASLGSGAVAAQLQGDLDQLHAIMTNAILYAFGLEHDEETVGSGNSSTEADDARTHYAGFRASKPILMRFKLVFFYAYTCAGIVLLFLTAMHILSKRKGWTPFNMIRNGICILLGVGLILVTALALKEEMLEEFMASKWISTTITVTFFVVLVLTHLPHPEWLAGKYSRNPYKTVEEDQEYEDSAPLRTLDLPKGLPDEATNIYLPEMAYKGRGQNTTTREDDDNYWVNHVSR